jgi:hypothetical protein
VLGSQPLAAAIQRQLQPGEQIICDGEYSNASSVNFYTGRQLLIYNGRINGLWFGSLFPDAPPIFLDDAQLAALWRSSTRIYFVTPAENRKQFLERFGSVFMVSKAGGKYVLSNRGGGTTEKAGLKGTPVRG